jgi:hypothetical protein
VGFGEEKGLLGGEGLVRVEVGVEGGGLGGGLGRGGRSGGDLGVHLGGDLALGAEGDLVEGVGATLDGVVVAHGPVGVVGLGVLLLELGVGELLVGVVDLLIANVEEVPAGEEAALEEVEVAGAVDGLDGARDGVAARGERVEAGLDKLAEVLVGLRARGARGVVEALELGEVHIVDARLALVVDGAAKLAAAVAGAELGVDVRAKNLEDRGVLPRGGRVHLGVSAVLHLHNALLGKSEQKRLHHAAALDRDPTKKKMKK